MKKQPTTLPWREDIKRYRCSYVEYDEDTDETIEEMEAIARGEIEPADPSYVIVVANNEHEAWIKFKEYARRKDFILELVSIEEEN